MLNFTINRLGDSVHGSAAKTVFYYEDKTGFLKLMFNAKENNFSVPV